MRCHGIPAASICATLCLAVLVPPDRGETGAAEVAAFLPADTSSPRATLKSFMENCNELYKRIQALQSMDRRAPDFRLLSSRILDCLDTSGLPEYARDQLEIPVIQ